MGNNSTPSAEEVQNCSSFLRRQIDLVQPKIVVTLGAIALKAVSLIEAHQLQLSEAVRTVSNWYGAKLIPAYHPGQRAMSHRSFANQLADYQFISERVKRLGKNRKARTKGATAPKAAAVVDHIMSIRSPTSYFAIHKLFFLIEHEARRRWKRRLTDSYIVRQKEGPYCTDLHISKLTRALPNILVTSTQDKLFLHKRPPDLFGGNVASALISDQEKHLIEQIVLRYGGLSDAELKTRVYLTTEMRRILRVEKQEKTSMFNAPLLF